MTLDQIKTRIAEIDAMFDRAPGWGSWMVMCANERESLVNRANHNFHAELEHKWLARLGDGRKTD